MNKQLHIHIFGCSFTAGDELSDEIWFPWKFTEKHTAESFYKKRASVPFDYKLYQKENKLLAYPNLMMSLDSNITTYNYCHNGKSQRHNILDILTLVEDNKEVDLIYLQMPPMNREMIIGENQIYDVSHAFPVPLFENYVHQRLKLSSELDQPVQDILDMIMLSGYLKSKGIPFYFLHISGEMIFRRSIGSYYKVASIDKFDNIIDLQDVIEEKPRLLGGHLSKDQHHLVATILLNHIKEQIK